MLFRMPVESTWLVLCLGLAFRASLTTMVGTRPPPLVLSLLDSSHVTMIWPPALYQEVACTLGTNELKKASPCCTVPSCSSLMRFGVYQT
jgi:hypothetical protein